MNPIECRAEAEGYFQQFMPTYPRLHRRFEELASEHATDKSLQDYWSAFRKLKYFAFDVLFFLNQSIHCKTPDWSPLLILPRFEECYVNGISVSEDLKTMMALLEFQERHLTKDLFLLTLANKDWEKQRCSTALNFVKRHFLRSDQEKLQFQLGLPKGNANEVEELQRWELRHHFVHRFRPLWWKQANSTCFGFPRSMFDSTGSVSEEVWSMIVDAKAWEQRLAALSDGEFVSAESLLTEIHGSRAAIAETIFQVALAKLT